MKYAYFFVALFLFTTLACSAAQFGQSTDPEGDALYREDFSNPDSGWGALNNQAGLAVYMDAAYHIYLKAPNVNLWAHPGQDFGAARIEVDVVTSGGPSENRMGLICRMQDSANFYYFLISDDGYYGIGKVKDGQWFLLEMDAMRPHSAIRTGRQPNHLRADCVENLFVLYINDELAGSAADSDFTSGDVGVLAGSFDTPGVDVYFDNFVVYKP